LRTTKSATTVRKYPTRVLKWVSKTCRTSQGFSSSNSAIPQRDSEKVYPTAKKIEPQRKTTFAARVLPLQRFLKLKQK
jgi:hypothetical protein